MITEEELDRIIEKMRDDKEDKDERQKVIEYIRTNATSKAFVPNMLKLIHAPFIITEWSGWTLIYCVQRIREVRDEQTQDSH